MPSAYFLRLMETRERDAAKPAEKKTSQEARKAVQTIDAQKKTMKEERQKRKGARKKPETPAPIDHGKRGRPSEKRPRFTLRLDQDVIDAIKQHGHESANEALRKAYKLR